MTASDQQVRERLREIERAFAAFEKGERNRLYETRDSLMGLTGAVESSGNEQLAPLSEIASRMLGLVIMEGGLSEPRAIQIVRELLAYVEAQLMGEESEQGPGGVFHVVNSEKLGDLLVRKGLISADDVNKALLLQRVSNGRRIGQVLVAMNAIDQRTLDEILNHQRAETRRAETRRVATGASYAPVPGQPTLSLSPLPPLPGVAQPGAAPAPLETPLGHQPAAPLPRPGIDAPGLNQTSGHELEDPPKLGLNWLDNK
ncbi:MAG: hypothetical protein AAGG01_23960 [Planctomycetota bacterium]